MPMARALHRHLGIPAEDLLKEPAAYGTDTANEIDWRRFPLNEMAKREAGLKSGTTCPTTPKNWLPA